MIIVLAEDVVVPSALLILNQSELETQLNRRRKKLSK